MKKLLVITMIGLITLGLCFDYCLAKPKDDQGNNGKAVEHEQKTPPGLEKKNQPKQTHKPQAEKQLLRQERNVALANAQDALQKLDHSNWWYNPNDTRGQGNMGNVVMIAPFGHDKDSDRLALYGNRGRVIKPEPEPTPEPTPEPEPTPDPGPTLPPNFPPF